VIRNVKVLNVKVRIKYDLWEFFVRHAEQRNVDPEQALYEAIQMWLDNPPEGSKTLVG